MWHIICLPFTFIQLKAALRIDNYYKANSKPCLVNKIDSNTMTIENTIPNYRLRAVGNQIKELKLTTHVSFSKMVQVVFDYDDRKRVSRRTK